MNGRCECLECLIKMRVFASSVRLATSERSPIRYAEQGYTTSIAPEHPYAKRKLPNNSVVIKRAPDIDSISNRCTGILDNKTALRDTKIFTLFLAERKARASSSFLAPQVQIPSKRVPGYKAELADPISVNTVALF